MKYSMVRVVNGYEETLTRFNTKKELSFHVKSCIDCFELHITDLNKTWKKDIRNLKSGNSFHLYTYHKEETYVVAE